MDGIAIERDQSAIEAKHNQQGGEIFSCRADGERYIGKVAELPAWFLGQDFSFLKNASAQMWCSVLGHLLNLQALLKFRGSSRVREAFDALLPIPIIEVAREESYRYKIDPETFRFRGVAAMTNVDVAQFAEGVKNWSLMSKLQEALTDRREMADLPTALYDFANAPHFKSVEENGSDMRLIPRRAITVDLSLPDQVLIEDFKRWLQASRELPSQSYRAPRPLRMVDLDDWVDRAFVQYSLIHFWKERERARVSTTVLLEVLYPSHRRITDSTIRKTIHPNWARWLKRETHHALQALASSDV